MAEFVIEIPSIDVDENAVTYYPDERHDPMPIEPLVRCKDCKHGHITIDGEHCKWCDIIATHLVDSNEPNNGYDPEPYFDADFFCAWGERKEVDE